MLSTLDTLPQNGAKSVKRVEGLGEKVHGPRSQLHTPETCATWQELVRQRGHPEDGYQGREMDGRGPGRGGWGKFRRYPYGGPDPGAVGREGRRSCKGKGVKKDGRVAK
jgi:hypothetical protein